MRALAGAHSSARRWTTAGAILFAEYLLISIRFDAGQVGARGGVWTLAGEVGRVAKYAAIVAAASIMMLRRSRGESSTPPRVGVVVLLAHAAFFAAFWYATRAVFGADQPPAGSPTLWFLAWVALGAGAALTLAIALVGSRGLSRIVNPRAVLAMAALGAAAWLAGELTQRLWAGFSAATLRLVTMILRSLFSGVSADAATLIVTLDGFSVWVAPACSGLEGMGLVSVLMVGYLVAFRSTLRFPNALLLVPIAIVSVWLLNGVRLAALIAIGARLDASLAGNAFHAKAGWVLFCIVALGVSTLGRRSAFFSQEPSSAREVSNPAAPYLVPLLSLIATALVTGMLADRVDFLYGLRIVAAGLALYVYRRRYVGIGADFSIASISTGTVVAIAWIALGRKNPDAASLVADAFRTGPPGSFATWTVFRTVGSVVIVPICEELAFRGYLLRRIVDKDFSSVSARVCTPMALLGSSLAFGLVHERWLAASLAGIAYGAVAVRRGSLGAAIVAHAVTNGLIAAWVLGTGDWSHWI